MIRYKTEGRGKCCKGSTSGKVQCQRMSYAHGCLGSHFLAGEERFGVEWHQDDDSVW
jgi:uncharacterized protein (UPF0548 family)